MSTVAVNRTSERGHGEPEETRATSSAVMKMRQALQSKIDQAVQGDVEDKVATETRTLVEIIDAYMTASPLTDHVCARLSTALWTAWEQGYDRLALKACIEAEDVLLSLRPPGQPERAESCADLAMSLRTLYEQTQDGAMLDRAIELAQEALTLCPAQRPGRDRWCMNLALLLQLGYSRTGDDTLLDMAISLQQEALGLCAAEDLNKARWYANMAVSFKLRHRATGEAALLDKAIELEQEALDVCQSDHPNRALFGGSLAISLKSRYDQTGDVTLLDRAIEYEQNALDATPVGHPSRVKALGNLAVSLFGRYRQTADNTLLTKVIALNEEALELAPVGHPSRAVACARLAISLGARYSQKNDTVILDRIICLQREQLDLQSVGLPDRVMSCVHLATSLRTRYEETKDSALLDEAIARGQEALELAPAGHPDRAMACSNLSVSLRTRYIATADGELLGRAIELNQEALQITRVGLPSRWRYLCRSANLSQLVRPIPDWQTTIGDLHQVFDAPSYDDLDAVLAEAIDTLLRLDFSSISKTQQQTLLLVQTRALDIAALAAGLALNTSTQLQHTRRGSALGHAAFDLAIELSEPQSGMQLLERARGMLWSQMLQLRDPQLEHVPKELALKLRSIIYAGGQPDHMLHGSVLSGPTTAPDDNMRYAQRHQLQDVIREIRAVPGLSDFMHGPDINALLSAGTDHPVVVLVAGKNECHALVITSGKRLEYVPLPSVTLQTLRDVRFERLISQRGGAPPGTDDTERGLSIAKGSSPPHLRLAKLWRTVVKPVLQALSLSKLQGRARTRLHWCTTGPFAAVPVHAAGIYEGSNQECCADYVVSSYTPTLTALLQARKRQTILIAQQIQVLAMAAEQAHSSDMPRLHSVVSETREVVEIVTKAGGSSAASSHQVAETELLSMIQSSHIVHLACHGIQDKDEPHKSRFCLSTSDLTVSDLISLDLKSAFLAYLSACETAKGDQKYADEVVHLAASMLFAGFQNVVATMWAMDDTDGPVVAKEFYERLFASSTVDVDSVPYALDGAVAALRAKKVPPARWATFIHLGA